MGKKKRNIRCDVDPDQIGWKICGMVKDNNLFGYGSKSNKDEESIELQEGNFKNRHLNGQGTKTIIYKSEEGNVETKDFYDGVWKKGFFFNGYYSNTKKKKWCSS